MWGLTPEALARMQGTPAVPVDPEVIAEAEAKREAEKQIEEAGRGVCANCNEEIVKGAQGLWESEILVAYCPESRDKHLHKPKVKWLRNEGVVPT